MRGTAAARVCGAGAARAGGRAAPYPGQREAGEGKARRAGDLARALAIANQAAAEKLAHPLLLRVQAEALAVGSVAADGAVIVSVENVPSSDRGEIADLPLHLLRVTATGESGRSVVRLQADFAIDGCEGAYDDACTPRMRRIALRELPAE